MANDQQANKGQAGNADTLENGATRPVQGQAEPGAQFVGAHGGTDAAAAAQTSGSSGAAGGHGLRQQGDVQGEPGTPGGSPGAAGGSPGAGAVGGTGLGEANSADDTRGASGNTPNATSLGGDASGPAARPAP